MAVARSGLIEGQGADWFIFRNSDIPALPKFQYRNATANLSRFKLHVCIDTPYFSKYREAIVAILKDVLEKKIINSFKILDVATFQKESEIHFTVARQMAAPFVIYLHNDFNEQNAQALVLMCQRIEDLLQDVPFQQLDQKIASADIRLGTLHFIFRQTARDGHIEYLEPDGRFGPELHALGLKSKYYNALMIGLGQKAKPPVTKLFPAKANVCAATPLLNAKDKKSDASEDQLQKKGWLSCLCG